MRHPGVRLGTTPPPAAVLGLLVFWTGPPVVATAAQKIMPSRCSVVNVAHLVRFQLLSVAAPLLGGERAREREALALQTASREAPADAGTDGIPGGRHPIQGLMRTAMASLQSMVDVNTVVGDAVETRDGTVIVPVSQVSFGFAAGGGEYGAGGRRGGVDEALPFGGGSGAGVSVRPVGFLVVQQGSVRLLPVDQRASLERLLDLAPEVLDRLLAALGAGGHRPHGGASAVAVGASDGHGVQDGQPVAAAGSLPGEPAPS